MNRLCALLGIRYPILQGGMAHVARSPLVAAVSAAGGLGILGSGGMPPEVLAEEISLVRRATDRPFGVNLMLLDPRIEEQVEVVVRERVPVVTTGAGNPGRFIDRLKSAGARVLAVVPATALARRVERSGVDAIIAEGTESGGHVGEVTTLVLVPQVVDAVRVPVVAAGGIADGRGLAAAIVLGASGVQMGTRFLASVEAPVHPRYKEAVVRATDRSTVVTGRSLGAPVRAIENAMCREFIRLEKEGVPREEVEKMAVGGLRRAVCDGDVETGSLMAGQIAGLVSAIEPVAVILERMMAEARALLPGGALD